MKWLRYCLASLFFVLSAPLAIAGTDPVGWTVSGGIPANTTTNLLYGPVVYTFTNNLPYQLTCPLYILMSRQGEFINYVDNCSGQQLMPGASCTVSFSFQPTTPGKKYIALTMNYGKEVVPLPAISTVTTVAPPPLIKGVVTQPLPANMGAGEQRPFTFTYTNMNNGIATNVSSSAVTIPVDAGGGQIISTVDTCATLPLNRLNPGQSCTVSGIFQAGVQGNYTVSHTLSYDFGLSTTLNTSTFATVLVVGTIDTDFPSPMGAGEQNQLVFRFTNTGSGTVYGNPNITVLLSSFAAGTGGTAVISGDTCSGPSLAAGASCLVTVDFDSGLPSPPSYFATVGFTYAGGTVSTTAGPTNGVILITNQVTQDLPADIGTGEDHDVIFTFTNTGSGTAYNITTPEANFSVVGGICFATATTCGATLAPNAQCTATCTFRSNTPSVGVASVTDGFTYAGGTNVLQQTTATSVTITNKVVGVLTTPTPFPSKVGVNTTLSPVRFTFTNTGSFPVNGVSVSGVVVTTLPSVSSSFTETDDTCDDSTVLANGASCYVEGDFLTQVTGDYTIDAVFSYYGPDVHATPTPIQVNAGRVVTMVNRCKENVWYSFNGNVTQFGCASDAACPSGSFCNPAANGGSGACYWANPEPLTGTLQLGPMIGTTPTTSTVIVPDKGTTLGAIWQGKVAARTTCATASPPYVCETATCGSDATHYPLGSCAVGQDFASPSTKAEFKFIKAAVDQYGVQASNGINVPMSMGPTTETFNIAAPYTCATPGDAGLAGVKSFQACNWTPVTPVTTYDATDLFGRNYIWVRKTNDTPCVSNGDCGLPNEVCGLQYDSGNFLRACGIQIGYWTANQACSVDPVQADTFFNCNDSVATPNYSLLRNLYSCSPVIGTDLASCYNGGATSNCCGCINWNPTVPGVPTVPQGTQACVNFNTSWSGAGGVLPTIQWMKEMCPQLITYPDDTGSTRFTCNTPDPVPSATNIAEYTITFCPEVVSNPIKKKKVAS